MPGQRKFALTLTNGGLQLIRVTDNGCGIAADELSLALSRHATSKVEGIDDLERIRTLGFRGEALASLCCRSGRDATQPVCGRGTGAQVSAANGQLSEVSAAASPFGTTLTVRNLFSAVPARLKFLKSRHTEISHCLHMLEQYALAYPEIRDRDGRLQTAQALAGYALGLPDGPVDNRLPSISSATRAILSYVSAV